MGIRQTVVAGPDSFYPSNREKLEESIINCFNFRTGPGEIPDRTGKLRDSHSAYIVPHAGFIFSGPVAAHSYKHLLEKGLPENIVILGPDHRGAGAGISVYPEGKWDSPNGELEINTEITEKLLKHDVFTGNESGHLFEHSIEVQLPFINFIYGNVNKKPKIIPVSFLDQSLETCLKAGKILGNVLKEFPSATILTSTDFSHYVSRDFAEKYDRKAIERILEFDPSGLYEAISKFGLSLCGYGPIACCLSACKILEITNSELLAYGTSGDIIPGRDVVGYGAIALTGK